MSKKREFAVREIFSYKYIEDNGDIIDISIEEVQKTQDYPEGIRYSLVYISNGKDIVRYDNYRGHGHHKHINGRRKGYEFKDEWQLISDFFEDLKRLGIEV